MARVTSGIADQMLPKPPPPDVAFTARFAIGIEPFLNWQRFGKAELRKELREDYGALNLTVGLSALAPQFP